MVMTVYFGENLKRLRKERELTQEALAECLGVSFQTISKWERGETYPDITTLPEIAAFFEKTIDELLGADKSQREAKIKEYLNLFERMKLNEASSVLAEYEKAAKEFPNEFSILINYMELLHIEKGNVNVNEYKPLSDKMISIYNKIQQHCTDDAIRIRSKRLMLQHLMWQYQCLGWMDSKEQRFDRKYKEQAEEIFNTLPSISDSREYLSLYLNDTNKFDYSKWIENHKSAVEELSYLLQNVIIGYCYYDDNFSPQYKIEVIKHMNGIFQMIDTDENPTKNRIFIIYNNGHLGKLYAEIGNKENALKHLRLAAEQAVKFDSIPESKKTAIYYEQEERIRNMNMRERMYELMTEHYHLSNEFKATHEFQEIIKIME